MNSRAYILLDISRGHAGEAALALQGRPGVISCDSLDGSPDIMLVVEGADRQKLAELIMPMLASIDGMTEDLRLLVTRDDIYDAVCS